MAEPWEVPGALDAERLDRALALVTGLSRRDAGRLIDDGRVRVGRRPVTNRSRRVRAGELIEVDGDLPGGPDPLKGDPAVEVPVVWFDDQVVVVDKPAGLVVHPGAGNRSGTLVQGLMARFSDLGSLAEASPGGGAEAAHRPGIVHRLDKGTSGLLVVARTPGARDSLARQLQDRTMRREYLALVDGLIDGDAGLVDAPLGRSSNDPGRIRVQAGGRQARTHYEVLRRAETPVPVSLVRCRLETGRTHQIRVHLASIGHPVVGDDRYGSRARGGWPPLPAGRPFLHAALLSFEHPVTREPRRFESPLPADLTAVVASVDPWWVEVRR